MDLEEFMSEDMTIWPRSFFHCTIAKGQKECFNRNMYVMHGMNSSGHSDRMADIYNGMGIGYFDKAINNLVDHCALTFSTSGHITSGSNYYTETRSHYYTETQKKRSTYKMEHNFVLAKSIHLK